MEDFVLDADSQVSKPSQKVIREIPQHKEQQQKTYRVIFRLYLSISLPPVVGLFRKVIEYGWMR